MGGEGAVSFVRTLVKRALMLYAGRRSFSEEYDAIEQVQRKVFICNCV